MSLQSPHATRPHTATSTECTRTLYASASRCRPRNRSERQTPASQRGPQPRLPLFSRVPVPQSAPASALRLHGRALRASAQSRLQRAPGQRAAPPPALRACGLELPPSPPPRAAAAPSPPAAAQQGRRRGPHGTHRAPVTPPLAPSSDGRSAQRPLDRDPRAHLRFHARGAPAAPPRPALCRCGRPPSLARSARAAAQSRARASSGGQTAPQRAPQPPLQGACRGLT